MPDKSLGLQEFQDALSRDATGMTAAEAWKLGVCVNCKQPASPRCHSSEGRAEYRISGMCEECFDALFAEDESDAG
jgi:hypothetical protein